MKSELCNVLKLKWLLFFDFLDTNKDGMLNYGELEAFVNVLAGFSNLSPRSYTDVYNAVLGWWQITKRYFGSTRAIITKVDFLHAMSDMYIKQRPALVGYSKEFAGALFDTIDADCDGVINKKSYILFFSFLGYDNDRYFEKVFDMLDTKSQGILIREEFQRAIVQFHTNDDPDNSFTYIFRISPINV